MAWISSSVNPLAIRSVTVPARLSRGTGDVTGSMRDDTPSTPRRRQAAPPTRGRPRRSRRTRSPRPGTSTFVYTIVMPWFFSGKVRMRLPVAAKNAFSTAGAATQIVGSPTPPQKPPDGMMIDSTFGICAIRIES